MSCFPSTKAWRSLTSKLQSNLQKLRQSKTLARATTFLLRRSSRSDQSPYSYMQHKKKRKFRKRRVLQQQQHHHHHHHQHQRSFAPVYVDELFQQEPADHPTNAVQHVDHQKKSPMNDKFGHVASSSSSSSPSTVDVRAEMFIARFREEMRLQRQRSLEKYQEMFIARFREQRCSLQGSGRR